MINEEATKTLYGVGVVERGAEFLATMRIMRELHHNTIIGDVTDNQKDIDGYAENVAIMALVVASGGVSADHICSRVDYYHDNLLGS